MEDAQAAREVQVSHPVSTMIYRHLPDGSPLDYNRVFDAIDKAMADGREKLRFKDVERFLYQYRDAERSNNLIWDRHDFITGPQYYTEQAYMKDPTRHMLASETVSVEQPKIDDLMFTSEMECYTARQNVMWAISILKKKNQKLVMAAHYLCGADWTWISAVYGHQIRWARELHYTAMELISSQIPGISVKSVSEETETEIDELIAAWEKAETEFLEKLAEEKPRKPVDDRMLMLGLLHVT